jgi:hypothetical protein
MNTPTKTGPNVAGAAALPDVSELLADVADDAERLGVVGQLLGDIAQHVASARATLREVADTDPVHAVADLLAVAGWLADRRLRRIAGRRTRPRWQPCGLVHATDYPRCRGCAGREGARMTTPLFRDPDHPERLLVLVSALAP